MKRLFCLLLAMAIVFFCAACGGSSGGRKDKTNAKKLFDEPITFTLLLSEHTNQPVKTDTLKFKTITELTNVTLDVDVTPASAYENKIIAAATSGKMYDITYMNVDQMRQYSPNLYLDLTDKFETLAPDYWNIVKDDQLNASTMIDGKYYGFTVVNDVSYAETGEYGGLWPAMRTDILDENGLKLPNTWDEMFTTLKKLKKLYPDSTPISGRSKYNIIDTLEYSLGMYRQIHMDQGTGKYVCGVLEDEYYTVLKTMNLYYNEGILDNGFESVNSNTWNDGVNSGKIFFWIDNLGFSTIQTRTLNQTNPSAIMKAIPLMTNSFGKKGGGILYTDIKYSEQWVLSAKTADPEKAVKFMNWCYTDEGMLTNNYGKEGESYTVNKDGSITIPDSIIDEYRGLTSPDYSWMSDYGLGQLCFAPLFNQKYSISSFMNADEEDELYKANAAVLKADVEAGNTINQQTVYPDVPTNIAEKRDLIETYINQSVFAFVKGTKPLSEFNSFVDQVITMGIEEVLAAYNS